jgi:ATP-binding cassette, subfamily B, multidrug efflux pump
MLKLISYLRPFTWSIVLIFVLLFGQALCDLTLPDLMSHIVNIGIQQNGIETPHPVAIRASEMDRLFLFMSPGDRAVIKSDYKLLDKAALSPAEYNEYIKTYPGLASEPIYVLKPENSSDINRLNSIFGRPIVLVYGIEKGGLASVGVTNLPAGVDPFTALAQLSASQQEALRSTALDKIASLPSSQINQFAASYLYSEYQAFGLNMNEIQFGYIMRISGLMLLLTLLAACASITVGFISARIASGFARDTRRKLFTRVESFSNSEFDKFTTASLITRSTNDIQQIQMVLVILLRIVFYAPMIAIGGIIKAIGQDVSMFWIIVAAVAVLMTMVVVVFAVVVPRFRLAQKLLDRLNLITREVLSGLMVIRAFNTQKFEEQKFDKANSDLTRTNLFINRVLVFLMPVMMFVMNGSMLLVIWVGSQQVDLGSMQVGNLMAFMQYTTQIIFAFVGVSMMFIMLPRATVSAQRISEVLETEPGILDPRQPQKFNEEARGFIEFENVSFKYPGADDYVLQNVSFKSLPGQTTAFIGGTGSGKSSVVKLIPRFYDVTEGRILVDNIDIRQVSQHDLRDRIGYISQKTVLFSGTIESNLKYANENATGNEIEKAAEIAQSLDFIRDSERGFQTPVAQGGANFSGGQRQRMAIARALVKRPEIYIFDDSFSALDFKTDADLRRALKKETLDSTVLIVAQRINTVMQADQIVVLDDGRVAGTGTHKELMQNCKVYQELALSQLSKEELDQ